MPDSQGRLRKGVTFPSFESLPSRVDLDRAQTANVKYARKPQKTQCKHSEKSAGDRLELT